MASTRCRSPGSAGCVGPFLLLSGPDAARYNDRVATLLVNDLGPVVRDITEAGGDILDGPNPAPNGARLIARNPDGAVFEHIETGPRP
jgi:predicted enzyme related to lactoylglutathione lyase